MSSVSLPVTRSAGRALLVGAAASRDKASAALGEMGFTCVEADDPYGAMAELSRRPLAYGALVLSLQGVYREELPVIATVKRRFPHVEVWLTDTDGRPAGLTEAVGLGADGLLGDDGLHRIALAAPPQAAAPVPPTPPIPVAAPAPQAPPAASVERVEVKRSEAAAVTAPIAPPPPEDVSAPAPPVRSRGHRRSRAPAAEANATREGRAPKQDKTARRQAQEPADEWDGAMGEAVLTAEELRALLHEQPAVPPVADEE